MQEIEFDKEGRDKLINGINKLARAVGSTMGPNGKTVIIPDTEKYQEYKITKDGVSVANSIVFKDPVENIGAKLIKQAAQLTVDQAGDGTTTATVLATAFVNNLKDFNSNEINRAFDEIIPKVINELRKNSRQLKKENIKYVATISANNDSKIGEVIQEAYDFSSIIKVEEGGDKDELKLIEGMSLPVSYLSKKFITNQRKAEVEQDEPFVLVLDGKLENLKAFEQPIKQIAADNSKLLIITEHVHENILRLLESNFLSGSLNVCVIKAPGYSKHRKDLLKDIADFTGASVINDFNKQYNSSILGKLKSLKVTKTNSILVKDDNIDIKEYIEDLKSQLNNSLELLDKSLLEDRIENLTGKVATIKVGGRSEIEMKERKDRYDDAVLAVACALEEGIVEGGGMALYIAQSNICNSMNSAEIKNDKEELIIQHRKTSEVEYQLLKAISEPTWRIKSNGAKFNHYRLRGNKNEKTVNMFEENIIDPLKVTRCALENAVSVAKTILSTEAIVLSHTEWMN